MSEVTKSLVFAWGDETLEILANATFVVAIIECHVTATLVGVFFPVIYMYSYIVF
jgi:hypothetical protein